MWLVLGDANGIDIAVGEYVKEVGGAVVSGRGGTQDHKGSVEHLALPEHCLHVQMT